MAELEAFDLLQQAEDVVKELGGSSSRIVLAFDRSLPPSDSFQTISAYIVTFVVPTAVVAREFLKRMGPVIERLLDRSQISLSLEIGGDKPAKFSLKAGLDVAKKTIGQAAEDEES